MQLSFIRVFKYLNQRVRTLGEQNKKYKTKNKNKKQNRKKTHEEIEFHNSIQD